MYVVIVWIGVEVVEVEYFLCGGEQLQEQEVVVFVGGVIVWVVVWCVQFGGELVEIGSWVVMWEIVIIEIEYVDYLEWQQVYWYYVVEIDVIGQQWCVCIGFVQYVGEV